MFKGDSVFWRTWKPIFCSASWKEQPDNQAEQQKEEEYSPIDTKDLHPQQAGSSAHDLSEDKNT